MKSRPLLHAAGVLALTFGVCVQAVALPVMEIRAEDLMQQAPDLKKSLNLTPNQQTLWQQIEPKMHNILRERQARRERLQAAAKRGVDDPKTELRELSGMLDAEADLTRTEDQQLRQMWLTMNDALDDTQRQVVLALLSDQLARVADAGRGSGPAKDDGEAHGRGMGRRKSSSMGGATP